jgi:predicted O-methyltransferase YrrM
MSLDFEAIYERGLQSLCPLDATVLYDTAKEIRPRVILEIGAASGCSSMVLGSVAKECGGHLYTIEPNPTNRWRTNIREMGLEDYVTLIVGYSPWIDVSHIQTPIDYLLVDGKHKACYCVTDFHVWNYYLRPGGRAAFHDWHKGGWADQVQQAVGIILGSHKLVKIAESLSDQGLVVFEKPK